MGREFGWWTVPCQIGRGTPFVSERIYFVSESSPICPTVVAGSYWTKQFHYGGMAGRDMVDEFRRDMDGESLDGRARRSDRGMLHSSYLERIDLYLGGVAFVA